MRVIAVVAIHGVVPFDLAVPCEVFGRARLLDGSPAYEVRVCGAEKEVDAGAFRLRAPFGLTEIRRVDTLVVPGIADLSALVPENLMRALRAAARAGIRIVSICTGTFVLAATGLLAGRRATTHWSAAEELARRYPEIQVDPNVLFVDGGQFLTSAGAAAGLDLCLHVVRLDYGSAIAADVARLSVMPLERQGGQAQFIVHAPPDADGCSLEPLLRWLVQNLDRRLSLETIAKRSALSTRTLNRRFRQQTGTTPLKWLLCARVHRAQMLLEKTGHPIEVIATRTGFGSATSLRTHFQRIVGTSPQNYRRSFRAHTRQAASPAPLFVQTSALGNGASIRREQSSRTPTDRRKTVARR
jgi:transcriptional regulator GlxA family with amidase domain